MKTKDQIISFNYDCLIDETLKRDGSGLWNPRYGYGLTLGKGRGNLIGESHWAPEVAAAKANAVGLYKLHGSLHFDVNGEQVKLKHWPYSAHPVGYAGLGHFRKYFAVRHLSGRDIHSKTRICDGLSGPSVNPVSMT
jgi:hypothetical protein